MHTVSYEFLMIKPEESAKCHQTLSSRVGSGHETTHSQAIPSLISRPGHSHISWSWFMTVRQSGSGLGMRLGWSHSFTFTINTQKWQSSNLIGKDLGGLERCDSSFRIYCFASASYLICMWASGHYSVFNTTKCCIHLAILRL